MHVNVDRRGGGGVVGGGGGGGLASTTQGGIDAPAVWAIRILLGQAVIAYT